MREISRTLGTRNLGPGAACLCICFFSSLYFLISPFCNAVKCLIHFCKLVSTTRFLLPGCDPDVEKLSTFSPTCSSAIASSSESGTTYDLTAEAAERRGLRGRLFGVREDAEEEEATGAEAEVTISVLGLVSFFTLTSEGRKSSSLA